jgi:hypothetical protein
MYGNRLACLTAPANRDCRPAATISASRGSKSDLLRTLVAAAKGNSAVPDVLGRALKWRRRRDSRLKILAIKEKTKNGYQWLGLGNVG